MQDPEARVSVWKRAQANAIATGTAEERAEARTRADLRIAALGSGSDYTPFLQHLGVPSLALGFGGLDDDGVYHSIYDSFYHYTQFHDADFALRPRARADGRHGGRPAGGCGPAAVRVHERRRHRADVRQGSAEAAEESAGRRAGAEPPDHGRRVRGGRTIPRRPLVTPKPETVPPALNFAPLENAATALTDAAERYKKAADAARPTLAERPAVVRSVNAKLIQSERQLLDPAGLKNRSGSGTCSTRRGSTPATP